MFRKLSDWWFLQTYSWHRWRLDRALKSATIHLAILDDIGVDVSSMSLKFIDTWVGDLLERAQESPVEQEERENATP